MIASNATHVRRVRLAARSDDPLAVKFRTSRWLAALDLRPTGLPASAVLCIRRFNDPLPNQLRLDRRECASPEWVHAAVASMNRWLQTATRPAATPVGLDANAVLFLDRAELLACLARDWCNPDGTARWWWRSLFPGLDLAQALRAAWLETPAAIPAAIVLLTNNAGVLPFLHALDPADARQFLESYAYLRLD